MDIVRIFPIVRKGGGIFQFTVSRISKYYNVQPNCKEQLRKQYIKLNEIHAVILFKRTVMNEDELKCILNIASICGFTTVFRYLFFQYLTTQEKIQFATLVSNAPDYKNQNDICVNLLNNLFQLINKPVEFIGKFISDSSLYKYNYIMYMANELFMDVFEFDLFIKRTRERYAVCKLDSLLPIDLIYFIITYL